MILIGTLKGNGAGFTKLLERLIRGAWTPTAMEFMQPSLYVPPALSLSIFNHFYTPLILLQLYQGICCRFNHLRTGQKDRIDLRSSCSSILWNSNFLSLLQSKKSRIIIEKTY